MTVTIGKPIKRFEDDKLIRGLGQYVEDLKLPKMLHAVFVRSQIAHAKIRVNAGEARNADGVVTVITGEDISGKVGKNFTAWIVPNSNQVGAEISSRPLLATDKVKYAGEPVAMIGSGKQGKSIRCS